MTDFLNKLKNTQNEAAQEETATVAAPSVDSAALTELTTPDTSIVQDRPDLAAAHEALNNLMGGINVGMDNSITAVPSPAYGFSQFGAAEDGMATPGYYSISKGRVKGQTAAQVGGRFFFPLTVSEDMLEELESLVKAGVYEKVEASE